ncbi:UrcA family protein [Sphingomonas sp. HDW15A]|nr:UrcA family protein [Sphingomonas sp. HDW15A]
MSTSHVLSFIAACAITAGGFAIASPAFSQGREVIVRAAPKDDVPRRYVTYSDLNLVHPAGLKTLNRRVNSAVRDVCRESVGPNGDFYIEMGCRSLAWTGARPQIDRAVERARQIAANGYSTIAPVRISLSVQ